MQWMVHLASSLYYVITDDAMAHLASPLYYVIADNTMAHFASSLYNVIADHAMAHFASCGWGTLLKVHIARCELPKLSVFLGKPVNHMYIVPWESRTTCSLKHVSLHTLPVRRLKVIRCSFQCCRAAAVLTVAMKSAEHTRLYVKRCFKGSWCSLAFETCITSKRTHQSSNRGIHGFMTRSIRTVQTQFDSLPSIHT